MSRVLDIIIPTYKRPQKAIVAASSVLRQVKEYQLEDQISLTIWDDCTPGLDLAEIAKSLSQYRGLFVLGQNKFNKGMSCNIYDLVAGATSSFCTILTDDDWFEDNSLPEILEVINEFERSSDSLSTASVGAFFVPRYSYLDDGSLHCVECTPFACDSIIEPHPLNVIKYCRNAFILTGFFFRPALVDFSYWTAHQDNAFFPLLYYSSIAVSWKVKFLDRNWLHHTCLNVCHWEAWGNSELQRSRRLHSDYLHVLILVAHKYPSARHADRIQHSKLLSRAFRQQLSCYQEPALNQFPIVRSLACHSPVLLLTYLRHLLLHILALLKLRIKVFFGVRPRYGN